MATAGVSWVRLRKGGIRGVAGGLRLAYRVVGDLAVVRLPPPARPRRTDGLWGRTCFEAFVREPGGPGYRELNHSAAGWAAYRFDSYRHGMANADIEYLASILPLGTPVVVTG